MIATPSFAHRGVAAGLTAAVLVAGCAPSSETIRRELERGASGQYIRGVPFVRQRRNWCGPAALASVLQYQRVPLSQEEVAGGVYLEKLRGSLTLDLQLFVQEQGLWCKAGQGGIEEVRAWLDRGVPVIALLRENWLVVTSYHYVVLVGYHVERGYFLAHTGSRAERPLAFERFDRQHAAAGRWFLACARPEDVTWPLDADGHNNLALALQRQRTLEAALEHLRQAIRLEPQKALYHFNLGNLHAARGERSRAVVAYREALRLTPNFADAHNNLACVLLQQENAREALQHALRAVAGGGELLASYQDTLGRVLLRLGRHEEAVEAFQAAVQSAEKDAEGIAEARLGLIEALVKAGRREEAVAEKKALLDSTDDPAVRRRANALLP
jgi:tetratricopeptide (TPR) repeat protein